MHDVGSFFRGCAAFWAVNGGGASHASKRFTICECGFKIAPEEAGLARLGLSTLPVMGRMVDALNDRADAQSSEVNAVDAEGLLGGAIGLMHAEALIHNNHHSW